MLIFKSLNPFMDADGGAGGAEQKGEKPEEHGTSGDADERKTGEDIKAEAQKIADAMVAKKLKNMPSKDELAAYRKWCDDQKTESERLADAQKDVEAAKSEASAKAAKADAMISAINKGIKPQHIEDAVILAMARVSDEISMDEAMEAIAKNNPSWKTGVELPGNGGNPAAGEHEKKEPPILI